ELGEQDELGREPLRGIAQRLLIEHEHVVVGLVHEVVVQAVVVEVLELVRLERCRLDLVGGAEAVLEELARAQVPQLGLDERAQVRGRVVVELDDAALVAVHDDHGSPSDLRGGDRHSRTLPCVGVRKRFSPQRSQEGSIGSTLPGRFDVAWDEDLDGGGEYAGVDGRAAGGVAVDLDGDGGLGAEGDLAGLEVDEAVVAAEAVACGVPEDGGEVGEVAGCEDDDVDEAVLPGAGGLGGEGEGDGEEGGEQLADVGEHDADGADLELAAVGDDVEVGGRGAERLFGGGVDVGAEAPALFEGACGGGHDGGVEACAGDEGEGAAVDGAEVDVDGLACDGHVHGALELQGDVQVLGDLVGGAARDDGERHAGADEAGGGLGDGAVAADDADGAV